MVGLRFPLSRLWFVLGLRFRVKVQAVKVSGLWFIGGFWFYHPGAGCPPPPPPNGPPSVWCGCGLVLGFRVLGFRV